ncbi:MAG: YbaB/EbfC family nucleoid-associated protein [Dactylosporangium sp.]|nr:YbaB/EbfC family nucleoid-associated protein [Dactylosporangium sp.]NNJ63300.1 YbaB/EbfC family nucleoid-associated protein [Dactylosporangium sp.]
MGRDIDETWIEEAVERYRRIETLFAEFDRAAQDIEVTVRSPDGLVEVAVTAAGAITDVRIRGSLAGRSSAQLADSVRAAVTSAADAAGWARQRLHADLFSEYRPMEQGRAG